VRRPCHCLDKQESHCSLKWSCTTSSLHHCAHRPHHIQTYTATIPTLTDSPEKHLQVNPQSIATSSDWQCAELPQSTMPTSPSSTVQAHEHCRPRSRPTPVFEQLDSKVARTTPPEGSDFKAGYTHAKSKSSPVSIANICAHIHSSNAASTWTPAASRKSHHVPSISHKHLQPMRQCVRISYFGKDDSAPSVGSIKCRWASE